MMDANKKLHAAVVTELDQREAAILDLLKTMKWIKKCGEPIKY